MKLSLKTDTDEVKQGNKNTEKFLQFLVNYTKILDKCISSNVQDEFLHGKKDEFKINFYLIF